MTVAMTLNIMSTLATTITWCVVGGGWRQQPPWRERRAVDPQTEIGGDGGGPPDFVKHGWFSFFHTEVDCWLGALGKDTFARARNMITCGWSAFLFFAMPRGTNATGRERFEITARGGQTRGGKWGWLGIAISRAGAREPNACV